MDNLEKLVREAQKKNKGWDKVTKKYPEFNRPDWYAFRPKDCPVVIRDIDSSDINFYSKVEETLDRAGLFIALEESLKRQSLPKDKFKIGIKPNWMMALTTAEPHVSTNPKLVFAVEKILKEKGYKDIVIFESDNMYGNFIENHTVYKIVPMLHDVNLSEHSVVNLTDDVRIRDPCYIETRKMGSYPVAPTLMELNFLINMPKLKTHPSSCLTLSFKNMHGANFFSDKFNFLHGNALFDLFRDKARFWYDPTFELNTNPSLEYTKDMFTLVDAEFAQDGPGGWKSSILYFLGEPLTSPFTGEIIKWGDVKRVGKLIASRDPYKLEIATMLMANYSPKQLKLNPFLKLMHEVVAPFPAEMAIDNEGKNQLANFDFKTSGDFTIIYTTLFGKRVGKVLGWNSKAATKVLKNLLTIGEGLYPVANMCGWMFSGTDKNFPIKHWTKYKEELWQHSKEDWWKRNIDDRKKLKELVKAGKSLKEFEYGTKEIEKLKADSESPHLPYYGMNF